MTSSGKMGPIRSAAEFKITNSGATCHNVRFDRQYVATSGNVMARSLDLTAAPPYQGDNRGVDGHSRSRPSGSGLLFGHIFTPATGGTQVRVCTLCLTAAECG